MSPRRRIPAWVCAANERLTACILCAADDVTSDEIAYRGSDLFRVLQQEHVAAALHLLHFAVGQSVREIRSSFPLGATSDLPESSSLRVPGRERENSRRGVPSPPTAGCAWVASHTAICRDLQARGAEVVEKKDPLTDLLIRGSRVRIPDGSPRNRPRRAATLPSSSPPTSSWSSTIPQCARCGSQKKRKRRIRGPAAFSRAGSFVSTASLAR